MTVYAFAFLFLPGTFLHEFAHYLTAMILFVPAGDISLSPKLTHDSLKLGSVTIGKTDPFRRLLIGTAPVFIGLSVILASLYYSSHEGLLKNPWIILLLGYIVFEVGNTMFSSEKDMEGALELLAAMIFLGIICYILGLRIPWSFAQGYLSQSTITTIMQKGIMYLVFPIVVDLVFVLFLKVFNR